MVGQLHNQNRATIRALWRFTEKQLESERSNGVYSGSCEYMIVQNQF